MAADVHKSPAVATPFPLSLLLWLHTPLPILFLCWLGICVAYRYGGSRGADRKPMPYLDTLTTPEQGLFWAPWRGLSSASRPCLGLLWNGGNSRPTRMYFASYGFELCLNLEHLIANAEPGLCSGPWCSRAVTRSTHWQAVPLCQGQGASVSQLCRLKHSLEPWVLVSEFDP
jgi:hypothetical protein